MPTTSIDHITITAPSLREGAEFIERKLGVTLQNGGEHPRMGTHNLLLKLGDRLFLEVIAINPDAEAPARARWFELDAATNKLPKLATWVLNTTDINQTLSNSSETHGQVEPMSRGHLNWLITIMADGSLPMNGTIPTLIEWQTPTHPASTLEDKGLRLVSLQIHSAEPQRILNLLQSLRCDDAVLSVQPLPSGHSPYLSALIDTPNGLREL